MRQRDKVRLSEIVPIFENILTHRNFECDAFVAGKRGRCEKGLPDNFGVLSGPSAAVRLERRGGM
ncbi:MAG: hypothetical protein WBL48_18030 [Pseudolabrys sp.]